LEGDGGYCDRKQARSSSSELAVSLKSEVIISL
jgi:hypothetical protein